MVPGLSKTIRSAPVSSDQALRSMIQGGLGVAAEGPRKGLGIFGLSIIYFSRSARYSHSSICLLVPVNALLAKSAPTLYQNTPALDARLSTARFHASKPIKVPKSRQLRVKQDKLTSSETCEATTANSNADIAKLEVTTPNEPEPDVEAEESVEDPKPLRPLTSLNWPYVPEESAYPDPLKRDDPKPLQLHQYEAIATSSQIRKVLAKHPNLRQNLISIDSLRGSDREFALQRALGVTPADIAKQRGGQAADLPDDVLALRALAEAVEAAVRGGKEDALGLDWGGE